MPARRARGTALLLAGLLCGGAGGLHAQAAPAPFPGWRPELPAPGADAPRRWDRRAIPGGAVASRVETRSHTWTGLLVGGAVGAAATTVFLIGFCGDPDASCGADELGRAALIIGLPPAAVGALIGSLIRTERETAAQ
jgi:hypothetical protein